MLVSLGEVYLIPYQRGWEGGPPDKGDMPIADALAVAFKAPLRHAAPCSSTADALQRSCQQFARPLQSALQPFVEVFC